MKKKILLIIPASLILFMLGFVAWGLTPAQADAYALEAWQSDAAVTLSEVDGNYVFTPSTQADSVGLIFYPGARVAPSAYAPMLRGIAARGYTVIVVPMPLNLAVFGSQKADAVIADFPQIETWAIGGHSLGGAMAASYAEGHTQQIDGLVFWGAYAPESIDLRDSGIEVLSIYGSRDGLTTLDDIAQSRLNLPADAVFYQIDGGNHAQFGSYGAQSGDLPAQISAAEQETLIISATTDFLSSLP